MSRPRRDFLSCLFLVTSPIWFFQLAWFLAFSSYRSLSWIGHVLIFVELLAVFGLLAAVVILVLGPLTLLFKSSAGPLFRAMILSALFIPSFAVGLYGRVA